MVTYQHLSVPRPGISGREFNLINGGNGGGGGGGGGDRHTYDGNECKGCRGHSYTYLQTGTRRDTHLHIHGLACVGLIEGPAVEGQVRRFMSTPPELQASLSEREGFRFQRTLITTAHIRQVSGRSLLYPPQCTALPSCV